MQEKVKSFHIPSLDGIRALSFLIVFLAHAGLEKWVPGYFGLTVFFFLSGYLITTLLRMEYDKTSTIGLPQFYFRRVLRILPPFYLVLFLAWTLTLAGVLPGSIHFPGALSQALHVTNYYIIGAGWWDGIAPGTWVYWSLAVEEHFYLFFPLLYLGLRRFVPNAGRQVAVLAGLCLLVLAWRCVLVFVFNAPKDRLYVATDTRIDSILFGCILAIRANPAMDVPLPALTRWGKVWSRLQIPAALLLLGISLVYRHPQFEQTFRYSLQGLALIPLFTLAIIRHDQGVFRVLNGKALRFIGLLSYSLYLFHTSVIYGVQQWAPVHPLLQGVLAFVVTGLLSLAVYQWVEKPCAAWRKRLVRGGPPSSGRALVTGTRAELCDEGTSRIRPVLTAGALQESPGAQ
jgi:peptidoglycan/LPS O-acetylase OafA/YrhL